MIPGFGGTMIRPGEARDDTAAGYGRTIERPRRVKAVYDPGNIVRLNHNIKPVPCPT